MHACKATAHCPALAWLRRCLFDHCVCFVFGFPLAPLLLSAFDLFYLFDESGAPGELRPPLYCSTPNSNRYTNG